VKARTRNSMRKALMAGAVVMTAQMVSAGTADAQGNAPASRGGLKAATETVARYTDGGAWVVPSVMVATTPEEWNEGMKNAVESGAAVGMEPAPMVDWNRYMVVVVTMGSAAGYSLEVVGASQVALTTALNVHVARTTGEEPALNCHVVTVERGNTQMLQLLVDWNVANLPTEVPVGSSIKSAPGRSQAASRHQLNGASSTMTASRVSATGASATTWGALKNRYR
jgi:hypothetical protein